MFAALPQVLALVLVSSAAAAVDGSEPEGAVRIAGGPFLMGTDSRAVDTLKEKYEVSWQGVFENETPLQQITLDPFWIDTHEVTNAEFAAFVAEFPRWRKASLNPDEHNGRYLEHWVEGVPPAGEENRPVVFVTWSAAYAYCRWRSGRLPTEAEWEYAARSGDNREFPWGDALPSPRLANYRASQHGHTVDVGLYPANDVGIFDLAGNVWEFLADEWVEHYEHRPAVAFEEVPVAAPSSRRSVRGASFDGSIVNLRTRWRDSHVVSNAVAFVGFRCAYPDAPGR